MTMQPPAPSPTAPMPLDEVFAYYLAQLFASVRAAAMDALDQISTRLAEDFADALDALDASSGLEAPEPAERLVFYYSKPQTAQDAMWLVQAGVMPAPYSWEQQKAQYPRDYVKDQADFIKLRERARAGDFGLELQMQEFRWQAQQEEQARVEAMAQQMGALM